MNHSESIHPPRKVSRILKPLLIVALLGALLALALGMSMSNANAMKLADSNVLLGKSTLGDYVWEDLNANGIKDPGEPGINGVTVNLYLDGSGANPVDGIPQPDELISTTVTISDVFSIGDDTAGTNGDGFYDFSVTANGNTYIVEIDPSNFDPGGPLEGYVYTGNNASEIYSGDEPRAVLLIPAQIDYNHADFGFYQPLSLGDLVWMDLNNNGMVDAGESGIQDVEVQLYPVGADPLSTAPLLTDTTNISGTYLFTGLLPGEYFVYIPSSEFGVGQPLEHVVSSTGNEPTPDPDNDVNNDDNGDPDGNGGVISQPISLTVGMEPLNDGVDPSITADDNSNLTVDFGFYPPMSLGDAIWWDQNNNGTFELGENGISGVVVQLFNSGDDPLTDTPVLTATTDVSGTYLFTDLVPGDYFISIPASEFGPGEPLEGFISSLGNTPAPDPDDDVNSDDNGTPDPNGNVSSLDITLAGGTEPTTDGDTDANSNLTVDFGFFPPLSLGDLVWMDLNDSGTVDSGETGIQGVEVQLFNSGDDPVNDTPLMTTTTGVSGTYFFTELLPGDYVVYIPSSQFAIGGPLEALSSSTGNGVAPDPDDDINDDDNGDPDGNGGVVSLPVTLSIAGEPIGDGNDPSGAPDANGNLTVDFGFVPPPDRVGVGDTVWADQNNNGTFDPGEQGIAGVEIQLFNSGDDPLTATPLLTDTTDISGTYLFTDLVPGSYFIYIPSSEFGPSEPLEGFVSSTGNAPTPDPDDNIDGDDNGDPDGNGGVMAQVITLVAGTEPTDDGDGDANSNLTVDFGFFPPLSLGDLVWWDANNNGLVDGAEVGIANVEVQLFNSGDDPLTATPLLTDTTDVSGTYLFTGLMPGDYVVYIPSSEFGTGEPLDGFTSSTGNDPAPDPDDNVNDDDNGTPDGNGGVLSAAVTLTPLTEPLNDGTDPSGTPDASSNLTVDFGFYPPLSLGDSIWQDTNNNGTVDSGENGIPGVEVQLFRDGDDPLTDTPLMTVTTDISGTYIFTDLLPGDYFVVIPSSEFAPGEPLEGFESSLGNTPAPDPDDNVEGDDNGTPDGNGNVSSGVITLTPGTEPTPDPNSNLTVDFGFFPPLSLGDLIWFDGDNNGVVDNGEQGISGVEVQLFNSGDDPLTATPLLTETTDVSGTYLFTGLLPGDYFVYIPASEFGVGESLAGHVNSTGNDPAPDPDDDTNDDDNGTPDGNGGVASQDVTLAATTEPLNDGTDPSGTPDSNSNLTVDIGFFVPLSLGDTVWRDPDNSGTIDAVEIGIPGVEVQLFNSGDDPLTATPVSTDTTDISGSYLFTGLLPGDYFVYIPASEFGAGEPLEDFTSSTGNDPAPDPDDNVNDDDNGTPDGNGGVRTQDVTLVSGDEPIDDGDTDPNSNLALDLGFVPPPDIAITKLAGIAADGIDYVTTAGPVTYTYLITNIGGTFLSSIVITDDVGTADPTDDEVLDGNRCAGLAGPLAPNGIVTCTLVLNVTDDVTNVATATGIPTDPTGNPIPGVVPPVTTDPAGTIVVNPSVEVSKVLTSLEPVQTGDTGSFTILITNTGDVTITVLPLVDTFDALYMTFDSASPAPDQVNTNGVLTWTNLVSGSAGLVPNGVVNVVVNFTANADTTNMPPQPPCTISGKTCNVATVTGAIADPDGPGPLNPVPVPEGEDNDDVEIFNPTSVNLSEQSMEMVDGSAVLKWQSVTEVEMVGFNIWRKVGSNQAHKVNGEMIHAKYAGQPSSAAYSFIDTQAPSGEDYLYILEVILPDGRSENYAFDEAGEGSIYLPIVTR